MSNQFYNYISGLLINYFKQTKVKAGDRFYLQLDHETDVANLIQALKNIEGTKPFRYKHSLGEAYSTFSLPFGTVNLVVAYTSKEVKPDFLVTLRNLVGEQKDEWKQTALISIVSEQLDSIQGGSSDLQKEGMPLHPSSLFINLQKEIKDSMSDSVDRIILEDNLSNLMKEQAYQQVTFFEFEDIFTILQKGTIEDKEYHKFGLFKDPDLGTYNGKVQKQRLQENRELFDFVKKVHDYGLDEEELQKKFSPNGSKALIADGWKEETYSKVYKYHEEFIESNKTKKVELTNLKIMDQLEYWDRPLNEKSAGQRKRHIIIFNPEGKEEVELQATFSFKGNVKSLSSSFLRIPKAFMNNVEVDVKISNILAKIKTNGNVPTFARFAYKHDQKANLGAEFFIAVLPLQPMDLEAHKSKYLINPSNASIELRHEDDELKFGNGFEHKSIEIDQEGQIIEIENNEQLILTPLPEAFNDHDELSIYIKFGPVTVPFLLKNELLDSMPIRGQRISKLIRETGKDFQWIKENNRLVLENREFYFHSEYKTFFEWEDQWIEYGMKYAYYDSELLLPQDIQLGEELREAYSRYITYFKIKKSIPSLSCMTEELKKRAIDYLNQYKQEVQSFEVDQPAGKKGMDLFKLGSIHSNGVLYFTPFHPIMVAYKLKMYELLQSEEIDNSILNRLIPDSLVPFLYDENELLFKPDHQQAAMEWLMFKPVNKVSVSDANQYLAKVVNDKITQFKEHFSYLFIEHSQAPLQINVINIANDYEVIRGLFQWMLNEIESNGIENLKPVEVTLYKEANTESSFDLYAQTDSVARFEDLFNVSLNKMKNYDAEDILRTIREKLFFYKREPNASVRYAHITFYKMHAQEHHAVQKVDEMTTGIAIDGLYASVPSMKDKENYKSGFGIKAYSIEDDNYLTSTAYYVNELAANTRNGGNDSYHRGQAILSRTTTADEKTLDEIFASSHWVTFVDPAVDLEFFHKYNGNLVVIHYSDQYSSSSRYDAITVTSKSNQYYSVIKEFLKQKEVKGTEENVKNAIKAFNTFNGEWLLRIIGSKGHYDREKLSIISAIKYSLSYLDHSNIVWVPISLEEILRVAGVVNLNKTDGVFTAKNLGVKGSHSDDLLLIGLENNEEEISLHFYPVEVKIGNNQGTVLDKARLQVTKTKELLSNVLTGEAGNTFSSRFYRNFFAQLLISNAKKLAQSDFWKEKPYDLSDEIIEKLLKDRFVISDRLSNFIGNGAILSFRKDATHRSASLDEKILLLDLTMMDGYQGLVTPIKEMRNWMQEKPNDFIKEKMLSHLYQAGEAKEEHLENEMLRTNDVQIKYDVDKEDTEKVNVSLPEAEISITEEVPKQSHNEEITSDVIEVDQQQSNVDSQRVVTQSKELEEVRIKIGRAENSTREIYWEYGNKGLANRHLLISGKSGQGKTYFMQCLLLEKSKQGIPSIVIDYTEGFLPNQLEDEFVQALGSRLKQKIVYSEKLPINPFEKNVRDIGGISLPESNTDVAERIKSVFAAVYKTLGIQQLNAIYEAVLNGLERFDTNMNLVHLKEVLEEEGSNPARTALSQIRPLIDRNPFSSENVINWKDIVESDGEVYVIQLTGFPRDVQLIITEFILWDLWNYSVRFGNKNKPMPVIMDEAQNLDHTEKSPSARILTEGRKFGWSAWYATQFLKSQLDADELARLQNSSQKIYFAPPEQELPYIAASLAKDPQEKRYWENKLASLKKGQCIVHGPIKLENGELSNPSVTVVDISSLSERI